MFYLIGLLSVSKEDRMLEPFKYELQILTILHLIRGGPFDTWEGVLWFFLHDQTFFDSQLKRTISFRLYQKQTVFFSAVELKTIFFNIYFI